MVKRNINIVYFVVAFMSALVMLFICSQNSPIYPFNHWVDVNCIFTAAKSMFSGNVLYRDIVEQKGPIVYLIFGIASLVSNKTYLGLWLMELISVTGFLFFAAKIITLYTTNELLPTIMMPYLAFALIISRSFLQGGSAEELSMIMLSYSLYYFLRIIQQTKTVVKYEHVINGVCFGLVFWMKYTMIGIYISGYICILVSALINKQKVVNKMILNIIGAMIPTAVIFVYFYVNRSINDLWEVYFYDNIFLYRGEAAGIRSFVYNIIYRTLYLTIRRNALYGIFIYLGIVGLFIKKKKKECILIIAGFALSIILTCCGKSFFPYYATIFAVFSPIGIW